MTDNIDEAHAEIDRLRDLGQQLCAAIGVPDAVEPIGWARDLRAERAALWEIAKGLARHLHSAKVALDDSSLLDMAERDAAEARAEIKRLRDELAAAERCMTRDHRQAARATQGRDEARADLRISRESIAGAQRRIAELERSREIAYAERDEARAELERLRARLAERSCVGHSACGSPVHFDSCMSETPGKRIPDRRTSPVDRVQVFYGDDDEVSEVIEAPRAQTHPTEETR